LVDKITCSHLSQVHPRQGFKHHMNADLTVFGYKVNFKIEKGPYRTAKIQLGSTFPEGFGILFSINLRNL